MSWKSYDAMSYGILASSSRIILMPSSINAMTVSLARELAPFGIRVNAIAPGWVETPMTASHLENKETRKTIELETPLRRAGKPEEIAGPALFLVSPAASYITAQILHVNGGSYLNT